MAERIQTISELAVRAAEDPQLRQQLQQNPVETLESLSLAAPLPDTMVYRLVVGALGLTVLICAIGAIVLALNEPPAGTPEILVALGSAAVGALAGLLAPSPARA